MAVSHFETLGVDGLIANLDADTAIPEHYISQLVYFAALPHMAILAALTRSPNPIIRMLSATASAEIPTLSSTVARTVLQPGAHEAVTHLRTLYSDWPHALSDTPFREDCVYLQAFEKFICLAKHRPSIAPGMHALLVEVTGHHFTTYV